MLDYDSARTARILQEISVVRITSLEKLTLSKDQLGLKACIQRGRLT